MPLPQSVELQGVLLSLTASSNVQSEAAGLWFLLVATRTVERSAPLSPPGPSVL